MLSRIIPVFALLIAGCTYVPLLTPYKMDIQQGNVVTQAMVARLERGMTRSQVRFTLGTPLVVDPFRADRWDYVYLYTKQGAVTEQRRIVVVFKDDRLDRIEGDVVPAERARIDNPVPAAGSARSAQQAER
jgi:outer membrane protein assembly factor BamE